MKKIDLGAVLKRPIVTERSNFLKDSQNKLVLEVFTSATKDSIKSAVESAFKVTVTSVNTMKVPSKHKTARMGKAAFVGKKSNWKKAIVTLKQGDKVEFFEGV